MLSVSIEELAAHIPELEAGNRLTLVREGKPFAEVVPIAQSESAPEYPRKWQSEEERLAALAEFKAFLHQGLDLGGFKIEDRDALYDRD